MDLLFPVIVVAALGLIYWRFASGRGGLKPIDTTADRPVAFGYKIYWLAMQTADLDAACEALRDADPRFKSATFQPCNWRSGLDRILGNFNNREVFVAPPVDGWVLVVNWMPAEESAGGALASTLESLSERFGRAAAFGSHRGVSLAAWALAENGELVRSFSEADGTTLSNFGTPPPEEVELDLLSWEELHEMEFEDDGDEDDHFQRLADESTVIHLAAAWSLDPTTLDEREDLGVGRLARPR